MKRPTNLITNSLLKKIILVIALSFMVWQVTDIYITSTEDNKQQIKTDDKK